MAAYPSTDVATTITPLRNGLITRRTASGKMRSVDLNVKDVYRIEFFHRAINATDRNTLVSFFDTNRTLVFTFSPLYESTVYDCRFVRESTRATIQGELFDVRHTALAVKQ